MALWHVLVERMCVPVEERFSLGLGEKFREVQVWWYSRGEVYSTVVKRFSLGLGKGLERFSFGLV